MSKQGAEGYATVRHKKGLSIQTRARPYFMKGKGLLLCKLPRATAMRPVSPCPLIYPLKTSVSSSSEEGRVLCPPSSHQC